MGGPGPHACRPSTLAAGCLLIVGVVVPAPLSSRHSFGLAAPAVRSNTGTSAHSFTPPPRSRRRRCAVTHHSGRPQRSRRSPGSSGKPSAGLPSSMRTMRPGPSGVRPHSGQRPPCMRPSKRLSLPLMKLTCYILSRPWLRLLPRPVLSGPAPFGNSLPRCPPGLGLGDVLQGPGPPAFRRG